MCDSRATIDCHESALIHGNDGSLIAISTTHKRRRLSHNLNQKEGKRRKLSHKLKPKEGNDDGDKNKEESSHKRRRKHKRRHSSGEGYRRKWVYSKMQPCLPSQGKFILMSYNILGESNASNHRDLYCQVPSHILDWKMRKRLICQDLSILKPDVVCLQEVDHFDDLIKDLEGEGYIGVFKGRTGEAHDGCAIFWRKHVFSLLQEESIEFKELGLRDNVAQLCVFEMNWKTVPVHGDNRTKVSSFLADEKSRRRIVVGNIHVLFNPKRGDVKLGQVRVLLQRAYELSEKWGKLPVVIGGDFNSTPQSALYQFLASSKLDILSYDRRQISGLVDSVPGSNLAIPKQRMMPSFTNNRYNWSEDEVKAATGTSGCTRLKHPLKLCSTYACVKGSAKIRDKLGEPLATSYHSKFMGTVDYIWHSEGLIPLRVLDTLPLKVLQKTAGLPTMEWGSDHLALVCELTFSSY